MHQGGRKFIAKGTRAVLSPSRGYLPWTALEGPARKNERKVAACADRQRGPGDLSPCKASRYLPPTTAGWLVPGATHSHPRSDCKRKAAVGRSRRATPLCAPRAGTSRIAAGAWGVLAGPGGLQPLLSGGRPPRGGCGHPLRAAPRREAGWVRKLGGGGRHLTAHTDHATGDPPVPA